jgi:hypothetical protein
MHIAGMATHCVLCSLKLKETKLDWQIYRIEKHIVDHQRSIPKLRKNGNNKQADYLLKMIAKWVNKLPELEKRLAEIKDVVADLKGFRAAVNVPTVAANEQTGLEDPEMAF